MRIAGRPATGPSSRPPHAEPGGNRARATCGKRDRSGKRGSRAVASDGEVAVPLALNIADTTGGPGSEREIRSEEHTSELQSHLNLVCRLLLEKKKKL